MTSQKKNAITCSIRLAIPMAMIMVFTFSRTPVLAAHTLCCCVPPAPYSGQTKDVCGPTNIVHDNNLCQDEIPGAYPCPQADTNPGQTGDVQVQLKPQVTIPGSGFTAGKAVTVTGTTLGEYINALYVFFSGIIGILAAVMLMWGGLRWLTAAGNASHVETAKNTIYSAIIALVIVLGAFTLLNTISPELVKIRDLSDVIKPIQRIEQDYGLDLNPLRTSEALESDSTASRLKDQYNAASCPTWSQIHDPNGFKVFITGYYKPKRSDFSSDAAFQCSVGLNCFCPKSKRGSSATCQGSIKPWKPCLLTQEDINAGDYCGSTKSGTNPVDLFGGSTGPFTAAAGACFGKGTEFTLEPAGGTVNGVGGKVYSPSVWSVQDEGGDIQQLHLDLFTGYGGSARQAAMTLKTEAVIKIKTFCSSNSKAADAPSTCQPVTLGEQNIKQDHFIP